VLCRSQTFESSSEQLRKYQEVAASKAGASQDDEGALLAYLFGCEMCK
jgi:hypothetical protein